MKLSSPLFIALLFILFLPPPSFGDSGQGVQQYFSEWSYKSDLARKYLLEAEASFKEGDVVSACIYQKKASQYGIEATESLIQAFKENGSGEDISNITNGLNKWKELRDFC